MMSRVRRTAKHKSPQPMDVSERSWVTQPARKKVPQKYSSPLFSHKTTTPGLGGGLDEVRYGGYGGREKQRSLLQTVIHNLVDSTDEEEREAQRSKIQNDMEIADERLDELVREHRDKLHGTVSTFQQVDEKIKESQAKVRSVKESLSSCKSLLRCKRDELKRLWLEDVKYKNMLQMIDSIEEVKAVPELLKKYKKDKYYLHATELLNNSVARLERDLADVEALKDLKVELMLQKESLHEELIGELHRHLYMRATAKKPKPQAVDTQPSPTQGSRTGTLSRVGRSSQMSVSTQDSSNLYQDDDQVIEKMTPGVDPEEDSSHFMAILVESLSILGRVKDALDAIHTRMEKEFLLIIERASVQVVRAAEQEALGLLGQGKKRAPINSPKLLTKMLKMCFQKFQNVVSAHSVLLVHLHRAKRVYKKITAKLYEETEVWHAIQQVLQSVLEVYLAFSEDGSPMDTLSGGLAVSGPDFFAAYVRPKKNPTKASKKPFFRFESSRHAISVSSYMREQRDIELVEGGVGAESMSKFPDEQPSISQHLVCKPGYRNITVVFGPVREFILVIEEALSLPQIHCRLHNFLHDYVNDNFLDRVRYESFSKMGNCVKPETAKTIAPDQKAIKVSAKQYVLNSVLVLWQLVEGLRQLMKDLPLYSAHFLGILCELLIGYRDSVQLLYRELTSVSMDVGKGSGGGPETITSSRWARDDDINRMIRSLPNWMRLYQGSKVSKRAAEDLEKMQSVYAKESTTLTNNLGSDLLRQSHVMLNHENLRMLAILHESLDWFNSQLKQVVLDLSKFSNSDPGVNLTDGASMSRTSKDVGDEESLEQQNTDLMEQISQFSHIQFEFQSLSEMTIITLHLEVRCHCFYFLSSVQKLQYVFSSDAVGEDTAVRKLATDLKDIDQVMVAILSPDKYRYLFEGLGNLVATIFIASAQHLKSINTNGIKRMCSNISLLQSCLSKITLIREKDLDKARRYFELLYLNNEEIIHQLMEQGVKFSQKDYANALTLLANSSQTKYPEEKLKKELKQLETIFSQDAV